MYNHMPGGLRAVLPVRRSVRVGRAKMKRDRLHWQLEAAICQYIATGKRPSVRHHLLQKWCKRKHRQSYEDGEMSDDDEAEMVSSRVDMAFSELVPGANASHEEMTALRQLNPNQDLILHLALKLRRQEQKLARLRKHASGRTTPMHIASSAFLRFRTQLGAQMAGQMVGFGEPLQGWSRFVGVRAEDVIWRNLRLWGWERWIRKALSFSGFFFLTLFWAVLATLFSLVATLQSLTTLLPFLEPLNRLPPATIGVIQGIIPQVGLFILLGTIPYLMYCKYGYMMTYIS
jgi:hypothetical protein